MATRKNTIYIFVLILMLFVFVQKAYAVEGSIGFSPQSGSYTAGSEFNVNLVVNGGGTPFNAAQATVVVPASLNVVSLTTGNCDFAFVKTPSTSNPSFAGVILGSSSNSCNVYTLRLKGLTSGNATVVLADASIKSYKGASELLAHLNNGVYTITQGVGGTSTSPTPTQAPTVGDNGQNYYTVNYTVTAQSSNPANLTVVLDSGKETEVSKTPVKEGSDYVASFDNVEEGVHTITTKEGESEVSDLVVNVTGTSKNINVGSGKSKQFPIAFIVAGIVALIGLIAALVYFTYRSLKARQPKNPQPKQQQ